MPPLIRRHARAILIAISITLIIYTGLSVFGAVAAVEIPRLALSGSPASVGLDYEDIAFPSRDNLTLRGWFIPADGDNVIIIVHGGFQNRLDDVVGTLDLSRDLAEQGFNLLLFDLRGRGDSDGKGRSLCNIEDDLGGAFDYVISRGYQARRIAILGFCSGAASACVFGSREDVGALVLDGCFASINRMVEHQAAQRHIPLPLVRFFLPGVSLSVRLIYHYQLTNPEDIISRAACPILFIYEEYDELTPLEDVQGLLAASVNERNELWQIDGALHSEGYRAEPEAYIQKVTAFLNAALGDVG
jgi:pimeloyl-ACP methyl ester carboxylesterase